MGSIVLGGLDKQVSLEGGVKRHMVFVLKQLQGSGIPLSQE